MVPMPTLPAVLMVRSVVLLVPNERGELFVVCTTALPAPTRGEKLSHVLYPVVGSTPTATMPLPYAAPCTERLAYGLVVPMPTLPAVLMVRLVVLLVPNEREVLLVVCTTPDPN